MKNKLIISLLFSGLLLLIVSCDGRKGTYFTAKDSTAGDLSNPVVQEEDSNKSGIVFSVITESAQASLPESDINLLQTRLLNILTQNGYGYVGGDPCFVLMAQVNKLKESMTATAPTKYTVTYDIHLYAGNLITGEVFGSCSIESMGVGNSKEAAMSNAMSNLKNTAAIKRMLSDASKNIIEYYERDSAGFFNRVKEMELSGRYDLAVCMLKNVPQEATAVYGKAQELLPQMMEKMNTQNCSEAIAKMKGISSNKQVYDPEIIAWFNSIPIGSPMKSEAQRILDNYISGLDKNIQAEIEHGRYKEKEELAIRKLTAEQTIKANEELMSVYRSQYAAASESSSSESGGGNIFLQALVGTAQNVGTQLLLKRFM